MGIIKGEREWEKFKRGEKLTRRQAIFAMCYECNGDKESNHDCMEDEPKHGLVSCPLYQYHPHRRIKKKATPEQLKKLKLANEVRKKQSENT